MTEAESQNLLEKIEKYKDETRLIYSYMLSSNAVILIWNNCRHTHGRDERNISCHLAVIDKNDSLKEKYKEVLYYENAVDKEEMLLLINKMITTYCNEHFIS